MPDEVLRKQADTALARSPVQIATSEPAFVDKWPRAWRLLFILGSALMLWAAIYYAVRWVI